jgi:hypothetical protein
MSTGASGPDAAAAAIPCSKALGLSAPAPNTVIARPAERIMNERRERPVPAGSGMPASIGGRPRPARATPERSSVARENSAQWPWEKAGGLVIAFSRSGSREGRGPARAGR